MKVFVTGHRGYIGAHLVDVLRAAGHEVTGCDLAALSNDPIRLAYDLERGLAELHARMVESGFGKAEFEGDRFVRLRALAGQMERIRSGAAT